MPLLYNRVKVLSNCLVNQKVDTNVNSRYNKHIQKHKETKLDELKIRFDEDDNKYYVYFNGPFGQCAYQSEPFDTLAEAEAFKQEQEDSADFGE